MVGENVETAVTEAGIEEIGAAAVLVATPAEVVLAAIPAEADLGVADLVLPAAVLGAEVDLVEGASVLQADLASVGVVLALPVAGLVEGALDLLVGSAVVVAMIEAAGSDR